MIRVDERVFLGDCTTSFFCPLDDDPITYFIMILSKQKTSLFFMLSISITVFGALIKYNSWPLIIIGAVGMVIFHSLQFFQKEQRSPLDYSRHFLIVTFSCNYIFSILQLPYDHILTILTKTALIIFLMLYIKKIIAPTLKSTQGNFLMPSFGAENLSHLLADLATVYIAVASLFITLQWEFGIINGNVLLVIGLFSAVVSILSSPKSLGK